MTKSNFLQIINIALSLNYNIKQLGNLIKANKNKNITIFN